MLSYPALEKPEDVLITGTWSVFPLRFSVVFLIPSPQCLLSRPFEF